MKLYVQIVVINILERAQCPNVQDAEEILALVPIPFLPLVPINFNLNFVFILPDNGCKTIKIALF